MKIIVTLVLVACSQCMYAQLPENISKLYPKGTLIYQNIPYADDTLTKHLLDVYRPADTTRLAPVLVWIHGGAWMLNDKYADMGYMGHTIKTIIDTGFAIVSINYRYSTDSVFPAQLRDCNQALAFIIGNAKKWKLDPGRVALIGFSAGGHLASALALSQNNKVNDFYANGSAHTIRVKAVVDFYGPSDFSAFGFDNSTTPKDTSSPIALLLGGSPEQKGELAKKASPVTYVDKGDPPFLIIHGEKDDMVPPSQSVILNDKLKTVRVPSELIIVPGAPHYGEMFDAEFIRNKVFSFLEKYLR